MSEYDDPTKQLAWEFYWEGYKLGKWIEDYEDISKRMAKSRFERYLKVNHEG